ncbi:MAG: adenylate/guanylate cyclase domain-containing protein [Pseudomonadota bacterium]
MGEKNKKKLRQIFSAAFIWVVASVAALTIFSMGIFETLEHKTYDLRMGLTQRWRPDPKDVVLFYVDEVSLRQMEENGLSWPWPRELYSSALSFAKRGGARAVVFDLFFSEDSVYGVGDDQNFATGVANGPPAYFVLFLSKNEPKADPRIEQLINKARIPFTKPYPKWMPKAASLQSLPIEPLVEAASGFGNASLQPDYDGVYRRINLISSLDEAAIPVISLKVTSDLKGLKKIKWPRMSQFRLDDERIPLDDSGQMLINYYGGADTFKNYPLSGILISEAQIVDGKLPGIDPSIVKDKVVIIGVAAPGLYDLKPTPLAKTYPGPEVHATVIENLLTADFIRPAGRLPSIIIPILCALLVVIALSRKQASWTVAIWLIVITGALFVSTFVLFRFKIAMPIVPPFSALSIAGFVMILKNYLTEGRQKREIRKAFGQYLSPHMVQKIAENPDALKLGGETKELSIFFSDIADFTTYSEETPAEKLVGELNRYFSMATNIIRDSGGTLDKYIGDAIMCFWGAPLDMTDHAARAIATAMEIQKNLTKDYPFITRIGIHTGNAVVGNIGSDVRFNYTIIGDSVNLASRLEGLNKKFGTRIIISEPAFKSASASIEARQIGRVRVKGKKNAVGIYEPLGMKGEFGAIGEANLKRFNEAFDHYSNARFKEAHLIFTELNEKVSDLVSGYLAKECERLMKEPPEHFDGVMTFTTK